MKDKLITLIIGMLIGAIITATVFLIIKPKSGRSIPDFSNFNENGEFSKRRTRNSEESSDSVTEESTKTEDAKDENKE